ncbi:hypothetical protein HMPREF9946_01885 [Acetobacteraceae bacterium AT-5844]|nr:hypothetical protein HMPREF9946_01885 [Acetobacteraceae bacterium AT-5844]
MSRCAAISAVPVQARASRGTSGGWLAIASPPTGGTAALG